MALLELIKSRKMKSTLFVKAQSLMMLGGCLIPILPDSRGNVRSQKFTANLTFCNTLEAESIPGAYKVTE